MALEGKNGFESIPEKSGKMGQIFAVVLLVVSIFGILIYNEGSFEYRELTFCIAAAIYGEMVKCTCIFAGEILHLKKRYNGSVQKAFKASFFNMQWKDYAIIATTLLLSAIYNWCTNSPSFDWHCLKVAFMMTWFVPLLSYLLFLRQASPIELSDMSGTSTKNIADGLAWSFYFGYLKLILPSIMEVINLSENEVDGMPIRDHIEDHKLFIVIPKDCNCAGNFASVDPNIQFVSETHEKIISRAGNRRRVYKNSIYKVTSSKNETFYCMMEYATPLLIMLDMERDPMCFLTREERDRQAVMFYTKLKGILEGDKYCRGKYHLVLASNTTDLSDKMAKEILASRQQSTEAVPC